METEIARLRSDGIDQMWSFLMAFGQKSNIPALKGYCKQLQQVMMQKTAGQRANKPKDVDFDDITMIVNSIAIEAMALYLSGDLDKLEGLT